MAGESRTQDNVNKSRTVLDIPDVVEEEQEGDDSRSSADGEYVEDDVFGLPMAVNPGPRLSITLIIRHGKGKSLHFGCALNRYHSELILLALPL